MSMAHLSVGSSWGKRFVPDDVARLSVEQATTMQGPGVRIPAWLS